MPGDVLLREVALALLITGASGFAIVSRWRRRALVSPAGGLHLQIFLFIGLGLLTYVISAYFAADRLAIRERLATYEVVEGMEATLWPFLAGYVLVVILEILAPKFITATAEPRSTLNMVPPAALLIAAGLGTIGYVAVAKSMGTSGVGTILPVLKLFQYPTVTILVSSIRWRNRYRLAPVLGLVLAWGIASIYSVWRSEMIMFGAAIALGYSMRPRGRIVAAALSLAAFILIVLPFNTLKRSDPSSVEEDPVGAFVSTISIPLGERLLDLSLFWAERVDYARELGYMMSGLESHRIETADGQTYIDSIYQLVPRVVWPTKPSFNQQTGYELPRRLGLVSWTDPYTSWSVSVFGEAVWNFGEYACTLFVPIVFLLSYLVEVIVKKSILLPHVRWITSAALAYEFLGLVSLTMAVTYIVWLVLLGVAWDRLSRMTSGRRVAMIPTAQ